jgi:hypothetical protein
MINDYVVKLIENLPSEIKNIKEPLVLDLVLDGGIFNGSYLVGALYFLKEMEKRNYIKIDRISGCSVGSIVGFLYLIDNLEVMTKLYDLVFTNFRQSYNLKIIKEMKNFLGNAIPDNILKKVNNKFYITYNNIKKGTKKVKSVYKNVDDIIITIIKSSYIPFLIDGNILYENKYIDGINPFIFNTEPSKKILYLDLFGYDKIGNLLNVKNEKSNYHRILSGLLDIHSFFIKQTNTQMCSYVNDWNIINYSLKNIKLFIEKILIYLIYLIILIKDKLPNDLNSNNNIFVRIVSKIVHDVFVILLESYCI